ncbi:MAG: hypothetical protein WBE74_08970, partial [Terracidiphilus sp.]
MLAERWRINYNTRRLHSSLEYELPAQPQPRMDNDWIGSMIAGICCYGSQWSADFTFSSASAPNFIPRPQSLTY